MVYALTSEILMSEASVTSFSLHLQIIPLGAHPYFLVEYTLIPTAQLDKIIRKDILNDV